MEAVVKIEGLVVLRHHDVKYRHQKIFIFLTQILLLWLKCMHVFLRFSESVGFSLVTEWLDNIKPPVAFS